MSVQSEQEMQNFQNMLSNFGEAGTAEVDRQKSKYESHKQAIEKKFSETVKAPLDAIGGERITAAIPKFFKGLKGLSGTAKAEIKEALEKKDPKALAKALVKHATGDDENISKILDRPANPTDSDGVFSKIKSFFSKAKQATDKWSDRAARQLPQNPEYEDVDPFSSEGYSNRVRQLLQRGSSARDRLVNQGQDALNRASSLKTPEPTEPEPVQGEPKSEPSVPSVGPTEEQLAGHAEQLEEGESKKIGGKLFKKIGGKMVEEESIGGGPEDPFSDIASAVTGIFLLIKGLTAKKRVAPPPAFKPLVTASYQVGA